MKLLLDANLSFQLIDTLKERFSQVIHVKDVGLDSAGDEVIWNFALNNGFTIVSKDSDFRHLSFFHGAPPKVISIKRGQLSTNDCAQLLKASHKRIVQFLEDDKESFLVLE
jgi:predicted nuclease of predicted toxin-antitoxin system